MNEMRQATWGGVGSRPSSLDLALRRRLLGLLAGLRRGEIVVSDPVGTVQLGRRETQDDLRVELQVTDVRFYRQVAANGSVGAADAFIEGYWHCSNLVALVRLLVRNRDLLDGMETGLARWGGMALRAWHALRRNTRSGSRRNIAAHYDLGNDFFGLFLSSDLMYSSALWDGAEDSLEAASARKLDTIAKALGLAPGMTVMEIGTGWGGFALHAARRYRCHVTTTTISREQHALATQRVRDAGLQDQVTVLLDDYRDLKGTYDRVVSIEMIEAIGANYMETYFGTIAGLLKPDGLALVQAITIEDQRYAQALRSVDFIKRHVFPGSFIPSISAMLSANARASDMSLVHLHDFGLSYARTLEAWRERFMARLPDVYLQGFDQRFARLWEFYLAYCEGGFLERSIGVSHLLLAKPGARPGGAHWVAA